MHIAFRVDSSTLIGYGHVMRCLTLAHALAKFGWRISFISKTHLGNINHIITAHGYQLLELAKGWQTVIQQDTSTWLACTQAQDAEQTINCLKENSPVDCLIVDHYAIDLQWQQLLRPYCKQLMVIDDLANRAFDCDLLLDQTLNRTASAYLPLTPEPCQLLLGQDYMLLRDEFAKSRSTAKTHRQAASNNLKASNILISMGGSDPDNLSYTGLLALAKLRQALPEVSASLVLSSQSKHLEQLKQFCQQHTWCQLITDSNNMAELMLTADIAIGASGATAWERCCLGLPSLLTINADNQNLISKNLAEAGASISLGWHEDIDSEVIYQALYQLVDDKQRYQAMVTACFASCDGQGATKAASIIRDTLTAEVN
ncbi:UDP-2,4-diacetamido-2,4,6-trideoxy-beta-L-altropyranose hydrolase [Litorilituus sediminis]|uniref:UDP-2,4-diacetamido-2,4, 6-trideoxy-beta-L-altropyranose hydrolase n=1 Tax=Litorilituus sediminis TaxID=718192 RepID=A0A4P6P259_9GAMM|nr:UDP-2,4-diacetamido-2,4,6-trideoxy-beta-L-altropyranose hydrolase [Litorilituus sediminis]QBG35213.1 UDP-2,4-diacetamido-2,4,6-trideoxy-beta-L-altropyranose hydrolase [Litorilituus sediminis]